MTNKDRAHRVLLFIQQTNALRLARGQVKALAEGREPATITLLAPSVDSVQQMVDALNESFVDGVKAALDVVIPHIDAINADTAKGEQKRLLDKLNAIHDALHALKKEHSK